jgi:type I restriction-modification system DNA methylase subunit
MSLGNLDHLEHDLWAAADNLRANSKLTASEYSMPVLGLIFLRHASTRFVNKVYDGCRKDLRSAKHWDGPAMKRLITDLEQVRDAVVDAYRAVTYPQQQAHWLQSRFPDGVITAVPGLCKVVSRAEITAADGSFTPERYVGVGAVEGEDEEAFEGQIATHFSEIERLNEEAIELSDEIRKRMAGLLA